LGNKVKIIFMVFLGLILVAVGIFASMLLIQRYQASQAPDMEVEEVIKTTVIVLTRDLNLGDTIAASDVELIAVPVEIAPRNAIISLEEVTGRMIRTDMIQGEMVLSHNLVDATHNNRDLSFILSDNHVLMAFPGDDLMSRESIIQRGDIVDIFATFKQDVIVEGALPTDPDEPIEPETRTFTVDSMPNVSITAMVLEVIGEDGEPAPSILESSTGKAPSSSDVIIKAYLLALNPQDALILKHLKDIDAIFDIVLKSPTSTAQFDLEPVSEEYLIEYYGLEILP